MSAFTQMWKVDSVEDMNKLLSAGWKFIQVVYEARDVWREGWWSNKVIGSAREPYYLMGKPQKVSPRINAEKLSREYLSDYMERVKPEKETTK